MLRPTKLTAAVESIKAQSNGMRNAVCINDRPSTPTATCKVTTYTRTRTWARLRASVAANAGGSSDDEYDDDDACDDELRDRAGAVGCEEDEDDEDEENEEDEEDEEDDDDEDDAEAEDGS